MFLLPLLLLLSPSLFLWRRHSGADWNDAGQGFGEDWGFERERCAEGERHFILFYFSMLVFFWSVDKIGVYGGVLKLN